MQPRTNSTILSLLKSRPIMWPTKRNTKRIPRRSREPTHHHLPYVHNTCIIIIIIIITLCINAGECSCWGCGEIYVFEIFQCERDDDGLARYLSSPHHGGLLLHVRSPWMNEFCKFIVFLLSDTHDGGIWRFRTEDRCWKMVHQFLRHVRIGDRVQHS